MAWLAICRRATTAVRIMWPQTRGANGSDIIRPYPDPYSKIRYGYPISEYPCGYGYGYGFKF